MSLNSEQGPTTPKMRQALSELTIKSDGRTYGLTEEISKGRFAPKKTYLLVTLLVYKYKRDRRIGKDMDRQIEKESREREREGEKARENEGLDYNPYCSYYKDFAYICKFMICQGLGRAMSVQA